MQRFFTKPEKCVQVHFIRSDNAIFTHLIITHHIHMHKFATKQTILGGIKVPVWSSAGATEAGWPASVCCRCVLSPGGSVKKYVEQPVMWALVCTHVSHFGLATVKSWSTRTSLQWSRTNKESELSITAIVCVSYPCFFHLCCFLLFFVFVVTQLHCTPQSAFGLDSSFLGPSLLHSQITKQKWFQCRTVSSLFLCYNVLLICQNKVSLVQ